MDATTLIGTEKQVAWAEKIRADVLDRLWPNLGEYGWEENGDEPDSPRYHAYRDFLAGIPAAAFWIDARDEAGKLAGTNGIRGYEYFAAHPEVTDADLRRSRVPMPFPSAAAIFYRARSAGHLGA